MEKIHINNIDLAYERFGSGVPLMLIHGYPLDHTIWGDIIPILRSNFELILPDLRGFGRSTTVETPYTMSDMADDLAGLLDHLKIEKIALAGHSMGGYVAMAFIKKYPLRVSGLGLISSQAASDSLERKAGRYQIANDVGQKGVGVIADAMTPKLSADIRVQSFVRSQMGRQTPSAVIGALKAMAEREDFMTHLGTITPPVVLIHGTADALIPIERAKEIKAKFPFAVLVEVNGAGHMPMMEFPNQTADGLRLLVK
jgi:3-oxoadipate enol-lactonase